MARTRRHHDPDQLTAARVARKVGIRVALMSALMVVLGVMLLFSYLWVDDRQHRHGGPGGGPGRAGEPRGRVLDVRMNAEDLIEIVPVVAIAAIAIAGVGAMLFARQAVKPLEHSLRRQRNFIGDASHELRTPLAILDARVQQLQIMTAENDQLKPVVAELRDDTRVMTTIVNDLLAAVSEAENEFDPPPLQPILDEVHAEMMVVAQQRGVGLRVTGRAAGDPGLVVGMPEPSLRRSLLALLDNALGHTLPGTTVTMNVTTAGRTAVIRVTDQGLGITGIHPDQVFERFARGAQPAHAPDRASHGIGLALVHDQVTRYGGRIEVEHTGQGGTTMRMQVPLVRTNGHA